MLPNPEQFLYPLFNDLESKKVDVSCLLMDHICYRVESEDRYQELKNQLSEENQLLAETLINNRPIATFLLSIPFIFKNRRINCLELPSPKPVSPYAEGFEHVEFVINSQFSTFMEKYHQLQFDTKGMNKSINADIRLSLASGSVKFHHHPLEHVIRYLDQ